MEPHDALLLSVRRAANWEAYCAGQVHELEPDEIVIERFRERIVHGSTGSYVEHSNDAQLHLWIVEHQRALFQLARISKTALDAGVQERQVRLAEQLAGQLADVLRAILDELQLTPAQQKRAPAVVRRHLVALEGGAAA